jgi:hypothetical protein
MMTKSNARRKAIRVAAKIISRRAKRRQGELRAAYQFIAQRIARLPVNA